MVYATEDEERTRSVCGASISIESAADATLPDESVTSRENAETPIPAGVPEIWPLLSDSPFGNAPVPTEKAYGGIPPAASACGEPYREPAIPFGSDAVVITRGGATIVSDIPPDAELPEASVASAENRNVPAPAGVPVIAPDELAVSPAGRFPDTMVHV
jgi:hypothetical protein